MSWDSLTGYFDALDIGGVSVNFASYVGLDNVWEGAMGKSHARPTAEQFREMKALVDEPMKEGAFGLSSLLAMPPGSLATTDDLVELCKVVAKHGGIFSTHIRNEGLRRHRRDQGSHRHRRARRGAAWTLSISRSRTSKLWGRMDQVVDLIEQARQRGVNVQANVYPYTRGNNDLASIIPPWAHEGGTARMLERLAGFHLRDRLKKEITRGIPGWYNHLHRGRRRLVADARRAARASTRG